VQSSGVFVKINSVVAKQMLVSEARDLTAVYLEDLRQINNIDIVLELIEGGINNDKS
jgi:coenzyme F420-reducing hydrogenase gamma subunit